MRTLKVIIVCIVSILGCGKDEYTNVVMIGVDTLRPDHLTCYGYSRSTSPNIDRLAERGVLFENAVSQAPWTTPSFASVFTSLYPSQHGATSVNTRMRSSVATMAGILKARGYSTGAVVNATTLKPAYGLNRGFDFYDMPGKEERDAITTTYDALRWIDEHRGHPFFIFIHYFDPHLPYSPPIRYATLYDPDYSGNLGWSFNLEGFSQVRQKMFEQMKVLSDADWNHLVALYDGEIAYTDSAIGILLSELEKRHLSDNTLIIFLSDHGEEFFEHGGFEHGHSLYNELIRVPLILSMPQRLPSGIRVKRFVRLIDVLPTVLALLSIEPLQSFEGVNLLPAITSSEAEEPSISILPHDVCFSEAIRHFREKKSIIAYPWKLIYEISTGREMLFNIEDDPYETINLVEQNASVCDELEHHLLNVVFNTSDTWYVEIYGGRDHHRFEVEVICERKEVIGQIFPVALIDPSGRIKKADRFVRCIPPGHRILIGPVEESQKLAFAFQSRPESIPLTFNVRIDGKPVPKRTFLGSKLINPECMPLIIKARKPNPNALGRPDSLPPPPYVCIWLDRNKPGEKTKFRLDEQTRKELRSLGYIE